MNFLFYPKVVNLRGEARIPAWVGALTASSAWEAGPPALSGDSGPWLAPLPPPSPILLVLPSTSGRLNFPHSGKLPPSPALHLSECSVFLSLLPLLVCSVSSFVPLSLFITLLLYRHVGEV